MKKFKLLSLLLIITLFTGLLSVPAMALDDPVSTAQSVVLMNAASGDILYQKEADASFQPGALTTLATALVAADSLEKQSIRMDDMVTQEEAWRYNTTEASRLAGYYDGDSFTVEQLLYLAVLISAEDSANGLAQYISGSGDAFAVEMNRLAGELGCTGSNFVNAGGTYSDLQYSTAHDLALIGRAVFKNSQMETIFDTAEYTIPPTVNYAQNWTITTDNALIKNGDSRYYGFATAGKSTATETGGSIVAAASYNGLDVIAVVIGCPGDVFVEAKGLFEWVFANYGYRTLVSSTDIVGTLPVSMGNPSSVGVRANDSIQMILPNDQDASDITLDIVYAHEQEGRQLEAPIGVGEYLGDMTVYVSGVPCGTTRLVAATAVDISRLDYLHSQLDVLLQNQSVRKVITILLGALGLYLLMVVVYTIQRLVHLHSLRAARKARAAARARQEVEWLQFPSSEEAPADYLPETSPAGPEDFVREPAEDAPEEEPVQEPAEDAQPDEAPAEDAPQEEEPPEEPSQEEPVEEPPAPEEPPMAEEPAEEPVPVPGEEPAEEVPAPEEEPVQAPEEEPAEGPVFVREETPEEEPEEEPAEEPVEEPVEDEDAHDGGFYDEADGEEDEYYEDEDAPSGPAQPPEKPKGRWWKRK